MLDPFDFETQNEEKLRDMENLETRLKYQIRRLTELNNNLLTQLHQAHIQIKEFQEQQEVIRQFREKENDLLFLLEDFQESVHDYKEKIEILKNDQDEDQKQVIIELKKKLRLQDEQKKKLLKENNKLKEELKKFQFMEQIKSEQLQALKNDIKLYLEKYDQINEEFQTATNQNAQIIQQQQDQYEKFKISKEIQLQYLKEKAHSDMDQLNYNCQLQQAYYQIKQLQMTIEKKAGAEQDTQDIEKNVKGQNEKVQQLKQEIYEFKFEQHDLIEAIINLQKSLIEKFKNKLALKSILITTDEENYFMQILTLTQEQLSAQFMKT